MTSRRFELVEGGSSKFWEVEVDGSALNVRYGRIGTAGQTSRKDLASPEAAAKEEAKLVREKTGKGYSEVGAGSEETAPAESKENETKPASAEPPTATPTSETGLLKDGLKILCGVGDYDAVDTVFFALKAAGDGWKIEAKSVGEKHKLAVGAEALEGARGFVFFSQGSATADGEDLGKLKQHLPPFLLARTALAELRASGTTLFRDDEQKKDVLLTIEERRTIQIFFDGAQRTVPVLVLRGDDRELIVHDEPAAPVVFQHRWGGECFVEIQAMGSKLKAPKDDEDGEGPDVPEFSSYRDLSAPPSTTADEALVALLGAVIDAMEKKGPEGYEWWDAAPAVSALDAATQGKRVTGSKDLRKMIAHGERGGPSNLLARCLAAPPATGLSLAAQALIARRDLPLYVPLLVKPGVPADVDRRAHDFALAAVALGTRLWSVGAKGRKFVIVEWDTATGLPKTTLAVSGKQPSALHVATDGTLRLTAQDELLTFKPGASKPTKSPIDIAYRYKPLAFDPSGTRMASATTVYEGDTQFAEVRVFENGGAEPVTRIRLQQDTDFVPAALAADGTIGVVTREGVRLFDAAGQPLARADWALMQATALSVSSDGTRWLVIGDVGEKWVRSGRVYRREGSTLVLEAEHTALWGMSPDGTKLLRRGIPNDVTDLRTGAVLGGAASADYVGCMAITDDGVLFIGGGGNGDPGDALVYAKR